MLLWPRPHPCGHIFVTPVTSLETGASCLTPPPPRSQQPLSPKSSLVRIPLAHLCPSLQPVPHHPSLGAQAPSSLLARLPSCPPCLRS